jgi:hypothetical protein
MHTAIEKNYKKEKSSYRDQNFETATLSPPRQHQKINFSISDASQKE